MHAWVLRATHFDFAAYHSRMPLLALDCVNRMRCVDPNRIANPSPDSNSVPSESVCRAGDAKSGTSGVLPSIHPRALSYLVLLGT